MCTALVYYATGDDTLEVRTENARQAQALADTLQALKLTEDIVPGLQSLSLRFRPDQFEALKATLDRLEMPDIPAAETAERIDIPVRYGGTDGPDLTTVAQQVGLSETGLIQRHTDMEHQVAIIGFTPGFAYLSGLPSALQISRLATPRPRLAAGSIGLSGGFTGLYALAGPGGWPIIGKTDMTLFHPEQQPPFMLRPGMSVRFRAV